MKSKEILAKNLKAYRKMWDLSCAEVAEDAGIAKSTVENAEKGKGLRSDTLIHIADNLKIPIAALMSENFHPALYQPHAKEPEGFSGETQEAVMKLLGQFAETQRTALNTLERIAELVGQSRKEKRQ